MNIQRIGWATAVIVLSTPTARADDYIFTRLAHTSGPISQFPSLGPVLNNNGVAAVKAYLDDDRDAIVRVDGGTPTIIADDAGSFVGVGPPVDINDLGDVAFQAHVLLEQTAFPGVWVGDGIMITTIGAPFGPPFGITSYTTPAINNSGLVSLYVDGPSCPVGNRCIGIGSGGPITYVYTTDNIPAGTHIGVQTDMSETGRLVFSCYDSEWPNNGLTYLYRGTMDGAWPIEIDQVSSSGGFASVAVNNNGTVAYLKHINGVFDAGIYIGDEAGVTAISTTDGPFYSFHFEGVAINDSNDVAFTALLPGGSYGVYTGPDPIADKVIASGDPLDGSTVGFVLTTRFGLNNAGQIALLVGLNDGTQGIYLATPVAPCPEDLDCTVGPHDFSAFRGFYDSGDLNSLLESDEDKLCYNPGIVLNPSEAPITLDFVGTLPNDSPLTLDVTIESSADTVGLELTISFWNYNTSSWDVVGTDTQSLNADTARTFAGNPADHVEPGTGEVRTRYEVRVVSFIFLFPWTDCIDHIFWTVSN